MRKRVAIAGCASFIAAMAATFPFVRMAGETAVFNLVKMSLGVSFLWLWGVAAVTLYSATSRSLQRRLGERIAATAAGAITGALIAGTLAGIISGLRLVGAEKAPTVFALATSAAIAITLLLLVFEQMIPRPLVVSPASLVASVLGLLFFNSSAMLRLDLFAPLTMRVMKFAHDFVHQFFESMLIPDHLFFSTTLWNYIGFLFGNEVGFWGALIIWLTPPLLILAAHAFDPLPSVAHIRQGARRRRLIADAIAMRRLRMIVPGLALVMFAGAIYQSRFPTVEYWDPKPLAISASPSGEIIIPIKGDTDLEDGKLHKYIYSQGGRTARFFVLVKPNGEWTVDLDACAICKPDGYGQAEGTVICYYCKTLIPLDTVGKPGGCNPVPMRFTAKEDGIHIDALALINSWDNTVQATTRGQEGGK
ncbi:DUF2318 domain-containing protein [Geobacter sp. SVR]|uniref:DUF2318 domain-containing protein n=1 Tax=Geobacter sp. SVR TaxID=2495594 RepID=UPI00143EFBFF|nr:DUF2318 domain-containing protein [Geobacter sp. SVR]BCS52113.1 hypothetical protein GSVR_04210 [Geobacter sp. SVR]GCF86568.1 hypothetical protein GSbR_31680 [Geobacter sp. SVR]